LNWAEIGVRGRSVIQRVADNAKSGQINRWTETGELDATASIQPPEDRPEVHIAREQIRKDGRIIIENVTRAIEQWQQTTSKPAAPM